MNSRTDDASWAARDRTRTSAADQNPNMMVERGADPGRLNIVFSGAHGNLSISPFDFYDMTANLGHSRILVRDPGRHWYQKGIGGGINDFPAMVGELRRHIDALGPDRVVVFGNSMGGFASMLAGHLLKADEVHAFGPQLSINPLHLFRHRSDELFRERGLDLMKLSFVRPRHVRLFDLPRALRRHNGTTRYYVHVCEGTPSARDAALLAGHDGIDVLTYPDVAHGHVVLALARGGYLGDLLDRPAGLSVHELHADRYAGGAR